jgi:hypothetical protein
MEHEHSLGSIRTEAAPRKTIKAYKLMRLVDGKLYPLYIDRAKPLEIGVWYNADAPSLDVLQRLDFGNHLIDLQTQRVIDHRASISKEDIKRANANNQRWIHVIKQATKIGYKQWGISKSGGKEVKNDSYSYRPGWHAGQLPVMNQVAYDKTESHPKGFLDESFVFTEIEISADIDYCAVARANGGELYYLPENGYYIRCTNANRKAAQADELDWYIAGAIRINRIISDREARDIIDRYNRKHGTHVAHSVPRKSGKMFNAETMSLEGLHGTKKAKQPTNEGKYIDDERHKFFMRLITKGRVKVEAAQELSLMLVNAMVEISQWKKRQYENPENTTDSLYFQNRMAAHDIVTRITGELLDKGVRVKAAIAVCDMIRDCLLEFAQWKDQQHEAEKGLQGTKKADMKSANLRLHNAEPSVEALFGRKSSLLGSSNNTFSQIDIDEAKLEKNTQSAKNNLKKYQNGDYKPFDIPLKKLKLESLGRVLLWLRRLFKMIYHGQSSYNYYITPKGLLNFRISNHNANPKNFKANNADFNISVYVALFEHKYPDADVEYTEYRYSKEDYEAYAEKIIDAIINGFGHALETGEFVDCSGYAKVIEHKKAVQPTDQSAPLPDTNAAAPFDIWFSGSKVVDADGNPLVVYHGTNAEFDTFDVAKFGLWDNGTKWDFEENKPLKDKGFFFTADKTTAKDHAEGAVDMAGGKPIVLGVYLRIEKPLIVQIDKFKAQRGYDSQQWFDMQTSKLLHQYEAGDYDGIIVTNPIDESDKLFVVFKPNQIKSATYNNGHFSPDSDNIFEGVSGSDTPIDERREAGKVLAFMLHDCFVSRKRNDQTPPPTEAMVIGDYLRIATWNSKRAKTEFDFYLGWRCIKHAFDCKNENDNEYIYTIKDGYLDKVKKAVGYTETGYLLKHQEESRPNLNLLKLKAKAAKAKLALLSLSGLGAAEYRDVYYIADCENEGDINYARREVTEAGGIIDDVVSESKDTDENIDDYYESKNWYVAFHCDTKEQFVKTCQKLGIRNKETMDAQEKAKELENDNGNIKLLKLKAAAAKAKLELMKL